MIPAPSLFVMTFGYSIAGGPRRRYVSDGLTPEASSFTRTSPWPASGVGSSPQTRTWSAAPCRSYQTARIVVSLKLAPISAHLFELLQRADAVGSWRVGIDLRPCGPRNLADIHIASRVDGKPVRRQEFAELGSGRCLAKTADQLALMIDNADARAEVGDITADRGGRADLADVKDRFVAVRHAQPARTVQVLPLCLELAVAVEHLDAVVFAVRDIDPAIGVAADVVHDVEFAFAGTGFTPRQ